MRRARPRLARGSARIPAGPRPAPAPPQGVLTARQARALVETLLPWFSVHARDLPWRQTRDPYAIWISEVMLQQTQVATVAPYWDRWLRQLPDIASLAAAAEDRVLKLWEGLGYYSRARNLHRAAREIVARHGGHFPKRIEDVLALPGIGRYTAGAIGSIAFNQALPIVDGNVIRVLTRIAGIATPAREQSTNARLWATAETLVREAARAGQTEACSRFNQALMELGALVCTPRQPRCHACPWRAPCVARRTNVVDRLPNLDKRAPTTPRRFVVLVVRHRGRWLVRRRPPGGVNAGLWEFPTVETTTPDSAPSRRQITDVAAALARELAGAAAGTEPDHLGTVKGTITRFRLTLEIFRLSLRHRHDDGQHGEWKTAVELAPLTFSSAQRRILRLILGPDEK